MFYMQELLGDSNNRDFCFTNTKAKGALISIIRSGKRVNPQTYPSNPFEVTMHLAEDHPGLLLPSFIGNTHQYFMVQKEIADIILQHNVDEVQVFPFTLMNHKNRVHSKDYVFLNPLGIYDCLNHDLSDFKRRKSGAIRGVRKYVIDKEKVQDLPDLFRVKEDSSEIFYSKRLVDRLREEKVTNFVIKEIEVG